MSKDQFHDDVLTEYTKRFVGVNDDRPVHRPQVGDFLGQLGLARERPARFIRQPRRRHGTLTGAKKRT